MIASCMPIVLLYLYKARNAFRPAELFRLIPMALLAGAFLWGLLRHITSGVSTVIEMAVFAAIPLAVLTMAVHTLFPSQQETLFFRSSPDWQTQLRRTVGVRVILYAAAGAGGTLLAATAIQVPPLFLIQQLLVYILSLEAVLAAPRHGAVTLYCGLSLILTYLLQTQSNTVHALALLTLFSSILLGSTPVYKRFHTLNRYRRIERNTILHHWFPATRVNTVYIKMYLTNTLAAALSITGLTWLFLYGEQNENLSRGILIILNAVWLLIVLSYTEQQNLALPILAGLSFTELVIQQIRQLLPGILCISTISGVSGYAAFGASGIWAAGGAAAASLSGICFSIRYAPLSLLNIMLLGTVYSGIFYIGIISIVPGMLSVFAFATIAWHQARDYYKTRVLDHA